MTHKESLGCVMHAATHRHWRIAVNAVSQMLSRFAPLALFGLFVVPARMSAADDYEAMNDRVNELEWRLATCEKFHHTAPCEESCGDLGGCGTSGLGTHFGPPTFGLYGGGQVSFLKLGHSTGDAGDYTYQASPRGWIGYQLQEGLGARARLFDFHGRSPTASRITDVDMLTLDFEVTHDFRLGKWEGMLSAGLRYTEYREEYFNNPANFLEYSNGYGGVVGIELNRSLTDWISLFGLLRESILMDDESAGVINDLGYHITEIQLGAELRYKVNRGYFFFRGAGEAQHWSGISNAGSDSVTLVGGNLSIGFAH